jgi:hypothetical protein
MHTWEIFSSNLLNESENSGLPVKFKNKTKILKTTQKNEQYDPHKKTEGIQLLAKSEQPLLLI